MFKVIFLMVIFSFTTTSYANIFSSAFNTIKDGVNTVAHATGIDKVADALGVTTILGDVGKVAGGGISLIGHPEKTLKGAAHLATHPGEAVHVLSRQVKDVAGYGLDVMNSPVGQAGLMAATGGASAEMEGGLMAAEGAEAAEGVERAAQAEHNMAAAARKASQSKFQKVIGKVNNGLEAYQMYQQVTGQGENEGAAEDSGYGGNPYGQDPNMGNGGYGGNPYSQGPNMGNGGYGGNPYGQDPNMGNGGYGSGYGENISAQPGFYGGGQSQMQRGY